MGRLQHLRRLGRLAIKTFGPSGEAGGGLPAGLLAHPGGRDYDEGPETLKPHKGEGSPSATRGPRVED